MFKHILLATDGSPASEKAVSEALGLAKALGANVTAVTATELWSALDVSGPDGRQRIDKYESAAKMTAQKILTGVSDAASKAGVACTTLHVPDQGPAVAIVETASREGCDLIIVGSHGRRGLDRLLLGSQAQRVVTNATCPVLVCR